MHKGLPVGILGINHKSAAFDLREKVALVFQDTFLEDKIILSTCHRTEIYFSQSDLAEVQYELLANLKKQIRDCQEHAFYSYFGRECFFHLACVTTGLDSALIAECDIQRQVKIAYEEARKHHPLSAPLHYLFQKSLKLGKTARFQFPLFQKPFHLESLLYQIISHWMNGPCRVLLVGNSDMNRKIIHYFRKKSHLELTLVTTFLETAASFELDSDIRLKDRQELLHWDNYDVIITATTAPMFLISSKPQYQNRHLFLDLSVPRVVDPDLKKNPCHLVLNMQQIGDCFSQFHQDRLSEILSIKQFLQDYIDRYTHFYDEKQSYRREALIFQQKQELCLV